MAVNIENTTVGFDASGLSNLINQINIDCIQATSNAMRDGLKKLNEAVDSCWQGQSAINFKNHMQDDAYLVIGLINKAGDSCTTTLKSAGAGMVKTDESITF